MATSSSPIRTRTSISSSSSINFPSSTSTASFSPLPTPAPRQDRSDRPSQLYRAYAVPVEEVRDRQVILPNNANYVSRSSIDKGKGKAVDSEGTSTSHKKEKKKRGTSGSRRSKRGLDLGLVEGWQDAKRTLQKRLPMAEGYPSCNYVGNGILSCYPESNTTIVEGTYSKFIWNAQFPTFIGAGDVDIYLYNANTEEIATSWLGVQNARGMIGITPDDEWWPQESAQEWFNSDRNQTIPYYFIVVDGDSELTGGETRQSTFTVIQTAPPSSLSSTLAILTASSLSSVSSISAASASASLSSLSSELSASSVSASSASRSTTTRSDGSLQPSEDGSGGGPAIPKWAIAIIVILGFFALVGGAFAIFFCLGRARKRRRQNEAMLAARGGAGGTDTEREALSGAGEGGVGGAGTGTEDGFSNSNASREPILGSSPTNSGGGFSSLAPAMVGAGAGGAALGAIAGRKEEGDSEDEKQGGLDRNEAARMAEAFRAALRRPEFPHHESSGESGGGVMPTSREDPGIEGEGTSPGEEGEEGRGRELIEEELRSEGMSMRDVAGGGGKKWG
ncbi:uncharacterized protein JCM6883_001362 [Sporobolomyces salmoneus]|uniref:uncharacterized protein n=1 Tax=Sporobolomyces salmoneus TaxID=183962 RepID=UPI00316BDB05